VCKFGLWSRYERRPAHVATGQDHVAGQRGRLGADTAARNPTSGFTKPEVVLREVILVPGPMDEASRVIRRPHGPKYVKNHRPGGAGNQTGSRNMTATRFFDSATPTCYSTPNTLWDLSRTVTKLSFRAVTITPVYRSRD